jgi:hypothetical protein
VPLRPEGRRVEDLAGSLRTLLGGGSTVTPPDVSPTRLPAMPTWDLVREIEAVGDA